MFFVPYVKVIVFVFISFFAFDLVGDNLEIYEIASAIRNINKEIENLQLEMRNIKTSIANNAYDKRKVSNAISVNLRSASINTILSQNSEDIIVTSSVLIDLGKLADARDILNKFLSNRRRDVFRGMAYFYLAESYWIDKSYEKAAMFYLRCCESNPNGIKSKESLYKLALSLKLLSKGSDSSEIIKQFLAKYAGLHDFTSKKVDVFRKIC